MRISKEGFRITTGTDGVDKLLFDSKRAKECADFAIKQNIRRINLYRGNGYEADNLDPILPLKDFIEGLLISEKTKIDKLHLFKKINYLCLPNDIADDVDLSIFKDITSLTFQFSKRINGLDACRNLHSIVIRNYKSTSGNLADLPIFPVLHELVLSQTLINSLQGIEKFTNLGEFEAFRAYNLKSIAPLQLLIKLEKVKFESCKKIMDFEMLGNISSLKKIILLDSGMVKSLSFVKKLSSLETITFWGTRVLDGDISYCEGIKNVGFDNKRHYTHKAEDFEK